MKIIQTLILPEILKTPFSGIPQTLILLASSNALLSLTPRYDVRVLLVDDLGTNFSNEYTSLIKGFYGKY